MKARSSSPLILPSTRLSILSLSAVLLPASLHAIDYTWSTTGTQPWATATNWTPNGAPAAADTVAISGTTATTITLDAAKSISALSISNTGTSALTSVTGPFALTLGSGGVSVALGSGAVTIGSTTAASNVNLALGASQTWTNATGSNVTIRSATVTGSGNSLTTSGPFDMRVHGSITPTINLGTGILTHTAGGFEIGTGSNTMAGVVLKGGLIFARHINNFGTTGTITLGDSAANTTAVSLRLATGTGNWSRPVILASGTTGTIAIDNLGAGNSPVLTGGITGTNNLTLQSTIGSGNGAVTSNTGSINFTGALTLRNQGTATANNVTGTVTINAPINSNVTTVTVTDNTAANAGITKGLQRVILGSAANDWTGSTTVSANSRLELSASEVIPHGFERGNVTVNGTLILRTATGDSTETINGLSGTGTINRTGATGTTTLIIGEGDASGSFSGPITNTAGVVALTKTGVGTQVLSGQNTYTGLTTVAGGTLTLEFADMIADTSNLEIASGATLNLTHTDAETVNSLRFEGVPQATGKWGRIGSIAALGANFESARITGDGLVEVTNEIIDLYWDGTGTSWASAAAWSIAASDAALNPSAAPDINNPTRFGGNDVMSPQAVTLDGNRETPSMTFVSPTGFTFLGGNGDHTLTVGSIAVDAMADGPTFGSLDAGQHVNLVLSGTYTWNNASTFAPLVALNSLDLGTGTLTLAGQGSFAFEGIVSGSGGITKTGTGNLDLLGTNTFAGPLTLQAAGTVKLGTASSLGTVDGATTVGSGATLDLNGQTIGAEPITLGATTAGNLVNADTLNPASLSGAINLGFNSNAGGAGDLTLSGIISQTGGARNLAKTGAGKLTLTNANTYTGTTTIANNTGIVAITNGAALGTGTVNISRGGVSTGTLDLSGDITVANNFTFASATGFGGAGSTGQVRNVSGNNTLSGTMTLNATGGNGINLESVSGLLTVTNTVSSTIADSTRQLGLGGEGNGVVSGNIVDGGVNKFSVIKSGSGTWTLSGVNTYTGTTLVNAGKLILSNNGGLADTATVTVATGATLQLDFTGSDTVAGLTLGGTVLGPGTYNASHPSGLITGTGSLVIPGSPDPFTPWIDSFTFESGADKSRSGDPDGDGLSNELEFALDGNPASGAATGKVVSKIDAGHLTLTLPVRTGATFTGTGPLISAAIDGVIYRIDGDDDLSGFTTGVEEVTALTANMPSLTLGWTYRTFRLTALTSAAPNGFLRAGASTP